MILFIKRDKTVDGGLFAVLDEQGRDKYFAKRSKNSVLLYDLNDNLVLKIKQIVLPALKTYSITSGEKNIKFMINSKSVCYFYGISWHIRGDFFAKSFDIINADNSVAAVHSQRFSQNGSGYQLTIESEHNELFCIGVAICANLESKVDNLVVQTV